jgi:toxin ParE1/3/4
MLYQLLITPAALLDVEDAIAYYSSKEESLGEKFASVVDAGLQQIARFPQAYGYRYKNIRGKFLQRFPYLILFQIDEINRTIQVVRIFNTYHNPAGYKN